MGKWVMLCSKEHRVRVRIGEGEADQVVCMHGWIARIVLLTFPAAAPWYRFVLDVAINILFSVVFLRVVIRQYRALGSECLHKLKRDGLFYMFNVMFSNIFVPLQQHGAFLVRLER